MSTLNIDVLLKRTLGTSLPSTLKYGQLLIQGGGGQLAVVNSDELTVTHYKPLSGLQLTGDATGTYNQSSHLIDLTLANSGVTPGSYAKVNVDLKGRVTAGGSLAADDIPLLTVSKLSDFTPSVQSISASLRLDQLTAPSASINLGDQRIVSLGTPISSADAATKSYVDGLVVTAGTGLIKSGNVISANLSTSDVAEGVNLYYTNARARGAFSVSAPLGYNSSTGAISIQTASGSQAGALTSADWTTFNNKLSATITSPTNGQVLQFNGTAWVNASVSGSVANGTAVGQLLQWSGSAWVAVNGQPGPMPTLANNASFPNTRINFSAGSAACQQYTALSASAITKRLDATFAVGNNNGGRFSGVGLSANTWYYCYMLYNPSTGVTDFGFDTSVVAANKPSGYNHRMIGVIRTDGSSNIIGFTQSGDIFFWALPYLDYAAAGSVTRILLTVTAPPNTTGIFYVWGGLPAAAIGLTGWLRSTAATNVAADTSYDWYSQNSGGGFLSGSNQEMQISVDGSSQIALRLSTLADGSPIQVFTKGFKMNRS